MRSWLAAVVAAVFAAPAASQVYVPIPVTGYTKDVIADVGGIPRLTTTSPFDLLYSLYEKGFNTAFPNLGVPSDGSIVVSANRSYQLGPINGNNSLWLGGQNPPLVLSGTLTLTTPARYDALSLLLADGVGTQPDQGGTQGTLAVHWSNGLTSNYSYTSYDWYLLSGTPGPNSGFAITGLDRVRVETGVADNNTVDPRLYYYDISLSADPNLLAGASINSVTATRQALFPGWVTDNIMGLSGVVAVPEPSALALLGSTASFAVWRRHRRAR